jgi:hypothetical protein
MIGKRVVVEFDGQFIAGRLIRGNMICEVLDKVRVENGEVAVDRYLVRIEGVDELKDTVTHVSPVQVKELVEED